MGRRRPRCRRGREARAAVAAAAVGLGKSRAEVVATAKAVAAAADDLGARALGAGSIPPYSERQRRPGGHSRGCAVAAAAVGGTAKSLRPRCNLPGVEVAAGPCSSRQERPLPRSYPQRGWAEEVAPADVVHGPRDTEPQHLRNM